MFSAIDAQSGPELCCGPRCEQWYVDEISVYRHIPGTCRSGRRTASSLDFESHLALLAAQPAKLRYWWLLRVARRGGQPHWALSDGDPSPNALQRGW